MLRRTALLVLCALAGVGADQGSVYYSADSQRFDYRPGVYDPTGAAAAAIWNDTLNATGWSILKVVTNPAVADANQAYAAGLLEGAITQQRTWQNFQNMYPNWRANTTLSPAVRKFLLDNIDALKQAVAAHAAPSDPEHDYWAQIGLVWQQLLGLIDGYGRVAPASEALDLLAFYTLNSNEDVDDIAMGLGEGVDPAALTPKQFRRQFLRRGRCSSLVKVAADLSDVFIGHTTWSGYLNMLRIFKTYTFPFAQRATAAKEVHFSGYPGQLSSIDDFFVMDSGLVTTETTIENFNKTLAQAGTAPRNVLYWIRALVANRMARTAPQWASIFSQYNSGSYNNEWMVLDMNRFEPGQPLARDLLWVVDQMPTVIAAADRTPTLAYGYWPSYNVPSDPRLFELAGYPEMIRRQGHEMLDYQTCARAEIFRRDNAKAVSLESFAAVLRYNDFRNDPLSNGDPVHAISARADLDTSGDADCFGGIDTKVISWTQYRKNRAVLTQSGPTWAQQPPFSYKTFPCDNHIGQPDEWRFPWVTLEP